MRYLTLITGLLVIGSGCNPERSGTVERQDVRSVPNPSPVHVPVTAAYVSVEPLVAEQNREKPASSAGWITESARSLGLAIRGVGTWQELPDKDDYGLHVTQREIITCRVQNPRQDGRAVVKIEARVAQFTTTVTLSLEDTQHQFIKLSERDGVALRLGWDGSPPPTIYGRALLIHKRADGDKAFPDNVPEWMTKVIRTWGFTSAEDIGSGKWIGIRPDPVVLGSSPVCGDVFARTVLRERSGTVTVTALLPGVLDENGNVLRTSGSVSPVGPGNEHPGNILSLFRRGHPEPYVTVLILYGQSPSSDSRPQQEMIKRAQQENPPDKK